MQPILWEWGPILLPAWHLLYVLGALAAYAVLAWLRHRHVRDLPPADVAGVFVSAYIGGYFGARILSILVEGPGLGRPLEALAALGQLGAMTFYGGAIGAFLAGWIYSRRKGHHFPTILDMAIPAALTALAIGRIGCFLNGDDFGRPVPLAPGEQPPWWAVTFPVLGDGVARYPVQLVSTVAAGTMTVCLCYGFGRLRRRFGSGAVAYAGIAVYAVYRYYIEFFRGDFRGSTFGGLLSTSQFLSLVFLALLGAVLIIRRARTFVRN